MKQLRQRGVSHHGGERTERSRPLQELASRQMTWHAGIPIDPAPLRT
ncbi:hypothetical protein ACPA9J_21690 [Pseudomonas aeruginosa]